MTDSLEWMNKLSQRFIQKKIEPLNPDQAAEVEQIIREAIEELEREQEARDEASLYDDWPDWRDK